MECPRYNDILGIRPHQRGNLMRKFAITLLAAAVLVSISTQESVHAQEISPSFTVGGGLGIPIGTEVTNNGPAIRAGASVPVYQNLHAVVEGHYSKNVAEFKRAEIEQFVSGPSSASVDVSLLGANIGIMLRSPSSSPVRVYGQGGIGVTRVEKGGIGATRAERSASVSFLGEILGESPSVSDTETVFSFTIGGGVQIPINPSIGVAVDARYSHAATEVEATKRMPITVSLVFGL